MTNCLWVIALIVPPHPPKVKQAPYMLSLNCPTFKVPLD